MTRAGETFGIVTGSENPAESHMCARAVRGPLGQRGGGGWPAAALLVRGRGGGAPARRRAGALASLPTSQ